MGQNVYQAKDLTPAIWVASPMGFTNEGINTWEGLNSISSEIKAQIPC